MNDPLESAVRRIAQLESENDALRGALTEACELWEHRGSRAWWKHTDPHLAGLLEKWNAVLGRQWREEQRLANIPDQP